MAARMEAPSSNVLFANPFVKGQSYSPTSQVLGVNFKGCPATKLSWSDAVSKLLQTSPKFGFCLVSKHRKPPRAITTSYLRDGTTKYFDFAVIGSGVAGLRYALEVAKHGTVAVITKAEPHESNTNYAQGGVSAVLSPSDSVESHMQDTIIAGAYLCDEETVRATSLPQLLCSLIDLSSRLCAQKGLIG